MATLVSLMVVMALLVVVVLDPRRRADGAGTTARIGSGAPHRSGVGAPALVAAFALLVGGWPTLVVAVVALTALIRRWIRPVVLAAAAVLLVGLALITTVPPLGPSLEPVWPLWPSQRGFAHELARLAVVFMVAAISGFIDSRLSEAESGDGESGDAHDVLGMDDDEVDPSHRGVVDPEAMDVGGWER